MMIIVQNYKISLNFLVNSDLYLVWTLVNSDLKSIRTFVNSDPIFKKNIGQFGPSFYGVRIDQWSRSELTKVRIDQGPNCPQLRSESGPN